MSGKIKLKVIFNHGFLEGITGELYVKNLFTEDSSHYRRLVLTELAKMNFKNTSKIKELLKES